MSFAKAYGVTVEHVRPHGAMYKMASEDFSFSCAIARAIKTDIQARSFVEGGSTITQQLAKNTYFTQEKKLERKIRLRN